MAYTAEGKNFTVAICLFRMIWKFDYMERMLKMESISLRNKVLKTALERYHTKPEYLWAKTPTAAVLRHEENQKWYALIMDVQKNKLGLEGEECVDILNVKADPVMAASFLLEDGILPAYHMNKKHWMTILLDGTVPMKTIELLLDVSFELTQGKKGKKKA